jgi:hypothetical protein
MRFLFPDFSLDPLAACFVEFKALSNNNGEEHLDSVEVLYSENFPSILFCKPKNYDQDFIQGTKTKIFPAYYYCY